jgi:type IV secretion system protein TrbJ
MMNSRFRVVLVSKCAALILSFTVAQPASAIIVFDPSNYAQSVITAARSLEQINNQIRSLPSQKSNQVTAYDTWPPPSADPPDAAAFSPSAAHGL